MITAEPIKMPLPAVGLYPNVDDDTYHAWDCMSYSRLKGMACPAKVRHRIDNPPEPTEALIRGSAVDCLVLTPERFNDRFVVADECCAIKTKGGKCENPGIICIGGQWYCGVHLRTKGMNLLDRHETARNEVCGVLIMDGFKLAFESPAAWVDGIRVPGSRYYDREDGQKRRVSDHAPTKRSLHRMLAEQCEDIRVDLPPYGNDDPRQIINQKLLDTCLLMRDSVFAQSEARDLLQLCADRQLSGVFKDEAGLLIKFRSDLWGGSVRVMGDLKCTAKGADRESFSKTIYENGYHIQAALYPDGMAANGQPVEDFAFIVVEVEAPHVCAVHRVGELTLEAGRKEYTRFKQVYRECEESGAWPAYPGISDVEISDYHLRKCGVNPKRERELV